MRRGWGVTLLLLAVLLLAACNGDDADPPTSPTPEPTATASAPTPAPGTPTRTPTVVPSPTEPPSVPIGGESGIAEVDAVIRAVLARDLEALAGMVAYEGWPCAQAETDVTGLPQCQEGEEPGAPAPFVAVGCEGGMVRDGTPELKRFIGTAARFHSVLASSKDPENLYFVVFTRDILSGSGAAPQEPLVLLVGVGRGITQISVGCVPEPRAIPWDAADIVLRGPTDPPLGLRTGIADVDAVLDALAARNVERIEALIQRVEVACVEVGELGGPPQCEDGEPEGTVWNAFPGAACHGYHSREDSRALAEQFVERFEPSALYSVVRLPEGEDEAPWWPRGEYSIVAAPRVRPDPSRVEGAFIEVAGGRITMAGGGCSTPAGYADWGEPMLVGVAQVEGSR